MNILVVNPANKPLTNKSILAEPIDVLNIATIIEKEYQDVQVIDMDVSNLDNNINTYLKEDNIIIFVYDYQLPLHTTDAITNIFETIKNVNKKAKYIIIGKTSSYYYEEFLNNGIDVVIKGIADDIINRVIGSINSFEELEQIPNLIFKKDQDVIKTKRQKLSNSFKNTPIPNRHLVAINNYMDTRTLITSRGCPNSCFFCSTPFYFGSWSSKSVEDIVDEIALLINDYHTKKIMFLDDNMLVDKKRMLDLCEELSKRKIKCLFGCLGSINYYDQEVARKMYEVGFRWLHFGIESGSEKILKAMHKEMNLDYVKEVIKDAKMLGYRIRTSFILDYPGTTKEDLEKTKNLMLELSPHEIRMHFLAYRVGTPVFNASGNVINKTQYIHSNKPNLENTTITNAVTKIVEALQKQGYEIIDDDINWNKYNEYDKDFKVAAFVPIKYGMCWYE